MANIKKTTAPEKRTHRINLTLNDKEMEALLQYVKKYKTKTVVGVVREATLRFIMERFVTDYPSLFDQPQTSETQQ